MTLLQQLCGIHAPSGNELALKQFIIDYVVRHSENWATKPEIIAGEHIQDCLILKFGEPKTAAFAHMDSVGFTARYENQLVPIGSPEIEGGYRLVGKDSIGEIECSLVLNKKNHVFHDFPRAIDRGTTLVFKPVFRETKQYVQCCYLDNRLGIYALLKVAETVSNGLLVFSCWEEQGGGSVPYLAKYIYEEWQVKQALVADITWVTDGVHHGKGVAISMRDRHIPRKSFVDKVIAMAEASNIPYQLEVEASGSSDGRELQYSHYPFDWCFVGAPEAHVHSPNEKVHKADIQAMIDLYDALFKSL